jgi:hypothetical protein
MKKISSNKRRINSLKIKRGNLKSALKYFLGDGLLRDRDQSLGLNQSINLKEMIKSFN